MTTAPPDSSPPESNPGARPASLPGTTAHSPTGGAAALTGIAGRVGVLLDQAWQEAQAHNAERRRLAAWAGNLDAQGGSRARVAVACMPPGPAAASPAPSAAPDTVPAWWLERRASVTRGEPAAATSAAHRSKALLDVGDSPA